MKNLFLFLLLISCMSSFAQVPVDLKSFDKKGKAQIEVKDNILTISWPTGTLESGKIAFDLRTEKPLLSTIQVIENNIPHIVSKDLDPAFIINVGKRDLISQNGWNIFFDKTAYLPYETYTVKLLKSGVKVISSGSRTQIKVDGATAGPFSGSVDITLYNGSPLLNIAAALITKRDSVAIIYDAGLVSKQSPWEKIFWSDTQQYIQDKKLDGKEEGQELEVKYRTIIGQSKEGSLAVFPAPHQYFYPLDNCYNLNFTWFGNNYRTLVPGYGIGIRNDMLGDRRWVPWFNAPPGTEQKLNFFCLISAEKDGKVLEKVKAFTHQDTYKPLEGYYTMASHFHQEHVDDVLTHKPMPEMPGFVKAFRNTGVNIVHLGEFHGPGSPKGPEVKRWLEQKTLFEECARLSGGNFLLLPGEEPNNFFGGHWMNIFPKPVYWVMARGKDDPFVEDHPEFGRLYRIGNKEDMLKLLEIEKGLAWTAHARTKGSTGFPDQYKDEAFFKSDRFLGSAWKALPADLSQDKLGKRAFDLMDDMANWGQKKYVIAEADLFRIEPEYELYGHMNINYLQLDEMPEYKKGWQPVLTAMETGKFFSTTGEILLPVFKINNKKSGESVKLDAKGTADIVLETSWTFPLNKADIISGDGKEVFREVVNLNDTEAFGQKTFHFSPILKNRKWVRLEIWDVAANGAFTQTVWLE
ncbi:hypothetical protein ACFP1I_21385 [Dyadobacter subterraneus]|uniref:Uncharacterized protein n=1 Tax=Dyadobacter subterraneus TaxID=2773304 RepID=A0ABR9W6T3_9BACT|nr:hypothetical protein [Dyadobacter subterraneus]MBE9460681.1 hypothetical protein [Dyadobacter subterraneus]